MDAAAFLGLEPTDDPLAWRVPVVKGLTTAGGFLFGGCALGAAVCALEEVSGRSLVWATAQYLSYARPSEVLDIDVVVAQHGRHITQARATGRVGDREILTVNAALGSRPLEHRGQWAERPDVPPPDECPPRVRWNMVEGTIMDHLEVRLAMGRPIEELDGTQGDGRIAFWTRLTGLTDHGSAASLAVLGDHVPGGISQSLGLRAGGNSLDNTLRVVRSVPTDWVLADIRVHAVDRGFGHGLAHLWAEDGTLLATASQSLIVRFWEERP